MAIKRTIDQEKLQVVLQAPDLAEFEILKELIYMLDEDLKEI